MMKAEPLKKEYNQLIDDGYCVVENVLQADMLNRLREVTDPLIDAQTEETSMAHRSSGSMVSVYDHPLLAELVSYPRALQAMENLGFCGQSGLRNLSLVNRLTVQRYSGTRIGGDGTICAAIPRCRSNCS